MSFPGVLLRFAGTAAALSSYALILPLGPPAAQGQASRIPVIDTIEGFNTANKMGRIASAKVRVIDQSQRPIDRAVVTFQLPENGVFLDGSRKADIETNGSGARYGVEDEELLGVMHMHEFEPYSYEPFKRQLFAGRSESNNTVFVRDLNAVNERIRTARMYALINGSI